MTKKHSLGVSAFPKGRFRRVYSAPSAEGGFFPPSWIEATSSANSLSNPNSCQCVCVRPGVLWKLHIWIHLGGYHWVPLKGGNRREASEVYNMLCILAEAQHLLRCWSVVLHHQKGKVLTITQGLAVQVAWNSSTRHNNASFLTGWRAKGISSDSSGISFHYTLGEYRIWLQTNEVKLRGKLRRNIATRRVPTAIQSQPKIGDPLRRQLC